MESKGLPGTILFLLAGVLATSVGLPRQFFAFAGGFSFGVITGTVLSSVAAIGGCAVSFFAARHWLARRIQRRYPSMVGSLNDLLVDDVFLKIIVLRLQPLGTNLLTNLCAGVSHINPLVFFSSSWLGYLPQMCVFALLGAGVRMGSSAHLVVSLASLFVSLLLGYWLYKRYIGR